MMIKQTEKLYCSLTTTSIPNVGARLDKMSRDMFLGMTFVNRSYGVYVMKLRTENEMPLRGNQGLKSVKSLPNKHQRDICMRCAKVDER